MVVIGSLVGCSRKKNTFLNRNWHAVTAKYNTLYNGNLALELGKEELNANYFDNYWEILPVERMQSEADVKLAGESTNPNFEVAEAKAVKAIQRHSMLIDGSEENPKMDEAYLLLGKARYYDQRFVPALEAFNYILHKYPLSNTIDQAKIWREKANLRLEFNELAVKNLKDILEKNSLNNQDRADASAMLAQGYINLSYKDSAIASMEEAAQLTRNNEEKGRYLYIKGQLYNELGMKDRANSSFDEVIALNRKTPRIYLINAYIAKLQNQDRSSANQEQMLELLTELAEDRENRPFLDKIYFQLAEFHYQRGAVDLATEYYKNSLREPSNDDYLQSLDYETLGNIYFDEANYQVAGAYYDSTLLRLPKNSRDFRKIKKKRDNLKDVIYYEDLARSNDSILYLVELSEEERMEFFRNYTEELRAQAETSDQKTSGNRGGIGIIGNQRGAPPGLPDPGSSFYFYDPSRVAYGKQEFIKTWGDRPLSDDWRTGNLGNRAGDSMDSLSEEGLAFDDDPVFDPMTYIVQIPERPEVLDSLRKKRNMAYYQLGLIYREKFGEFDLAAEKLEMLLDSEPEERLILPAKYNLFKIYEESGDAVKAAALKNEIVYQYPESRYASILEDPETSIRDENDPENIYNRMHYLFEEQEFEEVIHRSNEMIRKHTGHHIVPKMELLKAMATGRLLGFEAYREALNHVALSYPQSEAGKRAQNLYSEALPSLSNAQFQKEAPEDSYKLVFPFRKSESGGAKALQEKIEEVGEELSLSQLEISRDIYDPQEIFVVVHGFESSESAVSFQNSLSTYKNYPIQKKSFYISTPNYRIAQIHKNIETYLSNKTPN